MSKNNNNKSNNINNNIKNTPNLFICIYITGNLGNYGICI